MTAIIGIDPHKTTHMAVAIDGDERAIARLEVRADRAQTQRLLAWAAPLGAERIWVLHHSDRGAVYTSLAFSQRILDLELNQSFGAAGSCYDNAAVESFFATLKRELAWIHQTKSGQHAQRCEQRSSTTSRRSTTPYASNNASATAAPYSSKTAMPPKTRVHQTGSSPAKTQRT
jgi:transposase InsO family protein